MGFLDALARLTGVGVDRELQARAMYYATDGREILDNSPDGWEVGQPWLWWDGPAGGDGTGGPWGNPPPGHDQRHAMLPAITRCTNLIAGTLSGLPVKVRRGQEALATPTWLTDPQLLRPDATRGAPLAGGALSGVDFWSQWITSALWYGDGYVWAPNRDATGAPLPPMYVLNPFLVRITGGQEDRRYFIRAAMASDWLAMPDPYLPEVEIPAAQLLHLRGNPPYFDGHGRGALTAHWKEIALAGAVRSWAFGQFASGVPAGYLKVNAPGLTQPEADRLKSSWMAAHGGGARSIAVLNATTDFSPIQFSPLDAQLDQSRVWSLRDIALAFGVPSWFLGVPGDSSTYSNVESRFIELRTYTLLPWIRRVEAVLDAQFPAGTSVKLLTAGLERGDTTTRYAAYASGLSAGWLTIDEVRELEDLPPMAVELEAEATGAPPDTSGQDITAAHAVALQLRKSEEDAA